MKWNKQNKKLTDWVPEPDLRRKVLSCKTKNQLKSQIINWEKKGWKKRFIWNYFREDQINEKGNYCMIMVKPDPNWVWLNGKLTRRKI